MTWEVTDPNSNTYYVGTTSEASQDNWTAVFNKDNDGAGTHGEYSFVANVYDSGDSIIETTGSRTFTLDGKPPEVTITEDSDYVGDDPTIEVEVSDDYTDVVEANVSVDNDVTVDDEPNDIDCDAGETCTLDYDLDTSDIDEGDDFEFEIDVADDVGNTGSDSNTFTLDTTYEGDVSPSMDWSTDVEDQIIQMDDDVDLDLSYGDGDEDPAEVICYDGDTDDDDNEFDSDDVDDDNEARCTFDEDEFADGQEVELNIQVCDEAGNCETHEDGDYTIDTEDPELEEISMAAGAVNSDFSVDYRASDTSGISELEYFFESTVEAGDGNQVDVDSDSEDVESSFTVDPSDLDSGDGKMVYVRVKDSAGRWSNIEQLEFNYYPGEKPEIGLSAPSELDMTATQETVVRITVENTGMIPADEIEVTFADLFEGAKTVEGLEPGNEETVLRSFTPEESDIGTASIEVSATGFDVSKTISARIVASSSQQESISSSLETYKSRLEELKTNTSSLKPNLNDNLESELDSNVSVFEDKVNSAETAIEEGRYYEAEQILSGIDSDYSSARQSYEDVKERHAANQQNQMIMMVLGILLVAGVGVGGFAYHEGYFEQYDLDHNLDLEVVTSKLGDLGASSSDGRKVKGEDEEDEFEWGGFN
ncbi:hypothetical protein [Candidatus Nanohalococcus occultus]|uniref:CARDB domain-containing protein n=1 Tax=Candidatus Nanohalococcus occultus TaxID=2978047 RepID=A0ABY8CGK6_9ARCH|nr:hypothetical protein SVXNc_0858 [Candidatus Nanohaloarchaeota archaeon SVXNc]